MAYRILSVRPRGGAAIQVGQLTILVGPNNCGKSQTLKDIRQFTNSGSHERLVVLDEIKATLPTEGELRAEVQIRPHENSVDHLKITAVRDDLLTQLQFGPHQSWFGHVFGLDFDPVRREREILGPLGSCLIAYLGAEARFNLTTGSSAFNPRTEAPSNALQSLFASRDDVREELRIAFRDAFGMDIALDWAAMTRLYLRVANDFGVIPKDRDSLDLLMQNAGELEKQGDGFRSFAGVALAFLTYPTRILLLDEPEAFLHPAQARVLGRWVGEQSSKRAAQVVIATHSADFLAGLIVGDEAATVLRLNRADDCTSFHKIPQAASSGLIDSPLLSSQPVLDSLFHRGVVICEGDPDRAVYQTVAQRNCSEQHGEDFLFIHSNGKDAAKLPAKLLRESGTPVCVIADFDVINSEAVLNGIVEGLCGRPLDYEAKQLRIDVALAVETKSPKQSVDELKVGVATWLDRPEEDPRRARRTLVAMARTGSNKWDRAKKLGISCLTGADAVKAQTLIERLANLGLFVVPCGELESWMSLGLPKGNKWNEAALQALHADECPQELRNFVSGILTWLSPGSRIMPVTDSA